MEVARNTALLLAYLVVLGSILAMIAVSFSFLYALYEADFDMMRRALAVWLAALLVFIIVVVVLELFGEL